MARLQLLDPDHEHIPLGLVHVTQGFRKLKEDFADLVPCDSPLLIASVHGMLQLHVDAYIYIPVDIT